MKKIPCPECRGAGHITYMHPGSMKNPDLCGVSSRPCQVCGGAGFQEVPLTNGDRIRAMTDEELVGLFGFRSICGHIQTFDYAWCETNGVCSSCVIRWLEQPAKEE